MPTHHRVALVLLCPIWAACAHAGSVAMAIQTVNNKDYAMCGYYWPIVQAAYGHIRTSSFHIVLLGA